jgi:predicted dithiol-disulfide oxidoreductase (DUF899 family)
MDGAREGTTTSLPRVVSEDEWRDALERLRADEKAATRARDALAAKRRRLPMVRIEVYRTYFTSRRGVEALGSVWTFLDLTPLGRQESGRTRRRGIRKSLRTRGGASTTSTARRRARTGGAPAVV